MSESAYCCFFCEAESPEGNSRDHAEALAYLAGWRLGLVQDEDDAQICCPDCNGNLFNEGPIALDSVLKKYSII